MKLDEDFDTGSPATTESEATTEGRLHRPKGEAKALTKQGVQIPDSTSEAASAALGSDEVIGGGGTSDVETDELDTSVVQFSILFDGDEEKFAHLHALRDVMHRTLNVAFSEWRRSEKVASKRNPSKQTLERKPVTDAVKALMERERDYWSKQLPVKQALVEKRRVLLGTAKAKGTEKEQQECQAELEKAQREVLRTRVRTEILVPSAIYDSVVRFTQSRLAVYKKEEFRGSRAADSFTSGQPIRWRNSSWGFEPADRRGQYMLELPLSEGKHKRRGLFRVIPDGPSMHAFAKRMIDTKSLEGGDVKLCDARVVYSERKKQWFAKLTIRYRRAPPPPVGSQIAYLRRGVHHAFVIAFEERRPEFISGGDVLWFKRKLKARKVSIGRHKDRLEVGTGARGRGKRRREQALRKIHDAENRFVDWRCKTWAANLAAMLKGRHVGLLVVAKMGSSEITGGDEVIQALLHQWPFARMLDHIKRALSKVGIQVMEQLAHYNARRCPNVLGSGKRCGHVHDKAPVRTGSEARHVVRGMPGEGKIEKVIETTTGTFKCEVCEFEMPADAVLAMNGLMDAVGMEPMIKFKAEQEAILQVLKERIVKSNEHR